MKLLLRNWLLQSSSSKPYFKLIFILILCPWNSIAQTNLVTNPGFEIYDTCPYQGNQIQFAVGWDTLKAGGGSGGGGGEFMHECAINNYIVGVPVNDFYESYQWPHSGQGYAHFNVFALPIPQDVYLHDYIQTKLNQRLINGQTYCVTFYTNKTNRGRYAITEFGAYFDDGTIKALNGRAANVLPQIKSPSGIYLSDTLNWIKVQGVITSKGTEEFLTIGNFKSNKQTDYKETLSFGCCSEYYIDDVSVILIDPDMQAYAGKDTTIKKGASYFLGTHTIGDEYTWYANGVAFHNGSEAGLLVSPSITTTYVVKQQVCSLVRYDTCVVTVDSSVGLNEFRMRNAEFRIWPNPVVNGELQVENGELFTAIEVYTLLGEKVLASKGVKVLDVSALPKGLYLVKLRYNENTVTQRVVVQ